MRILIAIVQRETACCQLLQQNSKGNKQGAAGIEEGEREDRQSSLVTNFNVMLGNTTLLISIPIPITCTFMLVLANSNTDTDTIVTCCSQ